MSYIEYGQALLEDFSNWQLKVKFDSLGGLKPVNGFSHIAEDLEDVLSEDRLKKIKSKGDLTNARKLKGNDNRFNYDTGCNGCGNHPWRSHKSTLDILRNLGVCVANEVNNEVHFSGFYWYPYGGYCGWHTNSNSRKYKNRAYLIWSQDEGKSFFRYEDRNSKEVVTKPDKKGWQLNKFTLSDENLFWHCVGSKTNRISIGFKY
tara:strand:- start:31 stop:642 length:612 start_codon:yes stop_codon:yes gene_type:complete